MSKSKVFLYEVTDEEIKINEVTEPYSFSSRGLLKLGNKTTEMFFIADCTKKFEEELYDLSSKYFHNWNIDSFFDEFYEYSEQHGKVSVAFIKSLD